MILYGLDFLNRHDDLVIGSNERSWRVDVLFDRFGQIYPYKLAEFGQNALGNDFAKHDHMHNFQYPFKSGGGRGLFVFHK